MMIGVAFAILMGCDSLGIKFRVFGKWKAVDGTTVVFHPNGTLEYTSKGQGENLPGQWIISDNGRMAIEVTFPDGLKHVETGVLAEDHLMGYSLVMDADGATRVFIKLE
jgi:hypothetical protein